MATSTRLAEALAARFAARVSTCANTFKQLQSAGLVSRGGRGRHAPSMTSNDGAMLLLALLGSEHINDAPDAARRYSSLKAKWRQTTGSYESNAEGNGTGWKEAGAILPLLKHLDDNHTFGQSLCALIDSYANGDVARSSIQPTVRVTIRGPQISANIVLQTPSGTEAIDYGPVTARDMFRTVVGNPASTEAEKFVTSDLHVEKRITEGTLKALGKLMQT